MPDQKSTGARRGEATREAIETAAVDLFAGRGYHATSMREIAAAADIQPAAIYHWFDSKEEILTRLQDDFMDRLEEAVDEAVEAATAIGPGAELIRLNGDFGESRRPEIEAALVERFTPLLREDGSVFGRAATWIVGATNPG